PARSADPDATGPQALPAAAAPAVTVNDTFGEYELVREVGRGGVGGGDEGRQRALKRVGALKLLLAGRHAGPDALRRFRAEAEAAAALDHPSIVPIYHVGEHEGVPYLTMAYVAGPSLQQKVQAGPLPPREAAELVRQVGEAVAAAHRSGVVHRDLKPSNI